MISPPDHLLIVPWANMPGKALPDPLRVTYQLILSLAWAHDRRRTPPVSRRELAALRGIGLRTLDTHLRLLREGGWIQDDPQNKRRTLVLLPRHLAVEGAASLPPEMAVSAENGAERLLATAASAANGDLAGAKGAASTPPKTATTAEKDAGRLPKTTGAAESGSNENDQRSIKQQNNVSKRTQSRSRWGSSLELEEEILDRQEEMLDRQAEVSRRALEKAGVYPGPARRLSQRPWVTPGLVEAWAEALRANPKVHHVGAVLVKVLSDPDRCLPGPPGWQSEAPEAPESPDDEPDFEPLEEAPVSNGIDFPWEEVVDRLRETLGEEAVKIWLAESYPLSCSDHILVVALRSAYAVDWMQSRGYLVTRDALCEVTGERWDVRFATARFNVRRG